MESRQTDDVLWPGTWTEKAAKMLRLDLEGATALMQAEDPNSEGIPYETQGPDGPLFADFHSLRHSYIAMLDHAGLTLKQAMQLARHSDPKLTMSRYGRAGLHDLGAAVERMPSLTSNTAEPESTKATGTDGLTIAGDHNETETSQLSDLSGDLSENGGFRATQVDSSGRTVVSAPSSQVVGSKGKTRRNAGENETGLAGFEPATDGLEIRCSIP